jgi:uncharacterized DUF497 family protein
MQIIWDERKRIKNLEKHEIDFAELDVTFFTEALVFDAKQRRLKAIGILSDDLVAVIFARLGVQGISLISLRPASRKERNLYEQHQSKNPGAD